jgi:hypothetical protein
MRVRTQETNGPQLPRLLRARRERPRGRAAEQRDELAPFHSITSSASASTFDGMVIPSALAVERLKTSSNFVGCSTGMSPGFVPRRILQQDQQCDGTGPGTGEQGKFCARKLPLRSASALSPLSGGLPVLTPNPIADASIQNDSGLPGPEVASGPS